MDQIRRLERPRKKIKPDNETDIENINSLQYDELSSGIREVIESKDQIQDQFNASSVSEEKDIFAQYPILTWAIAIVKDFHVNVKDKKMKCTAEVICNEMWTRYFDNSDNITDREVTLEDVKETLDLTLDSAIRLECLSLVEGSYRITDKTSKVHRSKDKMSEADIKRLVSYRREARILEGWLYAPVYSNFIGIRIRRFFKGYGASEGIVDSYLPAELNDGIPFWHVIHDDYDDEDVDYDDLIKFRKYYLNDTQHGSDIEEEEEEEEEREYGNDNETESNNLKQESNKKLKRKRGKNKNPMNISQRSEQNQKPHTVKSKSGMRNSKRIRNNPYYSKLSYNEDKTNIISLSQQFNKNKSYSVLDDASSRSSEDESSDDENLHTAYADIPEQAILPEPINSLSEISENLVSTCLPENKLVFQTPISLLFSYLKAKYLCVPGRIVMANVVIDGNTVRTLVCCLNQLDISLNVETLQSQAIINKQLRVYVPLNHSFQDINISCFANTNDDDVLYESYHLSSTLNIDQSNKLSYLCDTISAYWSKSMLKQWKYNEVLDLIYYRYIFPGELLQTYNQSSILRSKHTMKEFIDFYHWHLFSLFDGNIHYYILILRLYACSELISDQELTNLKDSILLTIHNKVLSSLIEIGVDMSTVDKDNTTNSHHLDKLGETGYFFKLLSPVVVDPNNDEIQSIDNASTKVSNLMSSLVSSLYSSDKVSMFNNNSKNNKKIVPNEYLIYDISTNENLAIYSSREEVMSVCKIQSTDLKAWITSSVSNDRVPLYLFATGCKLLTEKKSPMIARIENRSVREILIRRQSEKVYKHYRRAAFQNIWLESEFSKINLRTNGHTSPEFLNYWTEKLLNFFKDSSAGKHTAKEIISYFRSFSNYKDYQTLLKLVYNHDTLPEEFSDDDLYIALQLCVEGQIVRRSISNPLMYRLRNVVVPITIDSESLPSNYETSQIDKMVLKIVELVYMMNVPTCSPSTIYDHLVMFYPKASVYNLTLPEALNETYYKLNPPKLLNYELFEIAFAKSVANGYLKINAKINTCEIIAKGVDYLFAEESDNPPSLRLKQSIGEEIALGSKCIDAKAKSSKSTYPFNNNMPIAHHLRTLSSLASTDKIAAAVQVLTKPTNTNVCPNQSTKQTSEAVAFLLIGWYFSGAYKGAEVNNVVIKQLLQLYSQYLLDSAVKTNAIIRDGNTYRVPAVPFNGTSSITNRFKEELSKSYAENTDLKSLVAETNINVHNSSIMTITLKTKELRSLISDCILKSTSLNGVTLGEIVEYITSQPPLVEKCNTSQDLFSSFLLPIKEFIEKGIRKGWYETANRDALIPRYFLSKEEKTRAKEI